jgi:hypothetical protein
MFCVSSDGKNIKFNEERARTYSAYLDDIAKQETEFNEPIKLDLTYQECQMFKKLIKYGQMPSCFITHEVKFMRAHTKIRDYLKIAKYDLWVFNIYLHIGDENPVLGVINQIPLIDKKGIKKARKALKKVFFDNKPVQLKNGKANPTIILVSFVIALFDKKIKFNFHVNADHVNDFVADLNSAVADESTDSEMEGFYIDNVYNGFQSKFFTVFLPHNNGLKIVNMTFQNDEDQELSALILDPIYAKFLKITIEQILSFF